MARYNVAQVQTRPCSGAVSMTVWAGEDFKTIVRYAKLARLMHTIKPEAGRLQLSFRRPGLGAPPDRRYGVAMARFLPALLACRAWRIHAWSAPGGAGT